MKRKQEQEYGLFIICFIIAERSEGKHFLNQPTFNAMGNWKDIQNFRPLNESDCTQVLNTGN